MKSATKNGTKNGTKSRIEGLDVQDDAGATERVTITAPNIPTAVFRVRGVAPYVQHKFSEKARTAIKETQEAGSTTKKGKAREAKDFDACYEGARHVSTAGWDGIPSMGFKNGLVSACRLAGFKMTLAKQGVFVEGDGVSEDGAALVRITKGKPRKTIMPARNANGSMDLRARPMFDAGWEATVRIRYDAGIFTATDIANLLMRMGLQGGIGEGRADSKQSCGMGWGHFEIVNEAKR